MTRKPTLLFGILAVIVVGSVGLTLVGSTSIDRVVVIGVLNVILVVGYHVFSGVSGVLSFGHMAFAMVGGYVAGLLVMPPTMKENLLGDLPAVLLSAEATPIVAVLLGGVAAAVLGSVMAAPLSRISGLAAGLASAAMLLAVRDIAINWDSVTRGNRGLSPLPTSTTLSSALGWLILVVVVAVLFERSNWGLRLRATRSDLVAATSVGISFRVERARALVLSAFITGVGGALFVLLLGSMTPDVFFLEYTFLVIAMAVVGGFGSLPGALVGAAGVSLINEVLRRIEGGSLLGLLEIPPRPGLARAGLGLILLAVLLFRPGGVASLWERDPERPPDDDVSSTDPTHAPDTEEEIEHVQTSQ